MITDYVTIFCNWSRDTLKQIYQKLPNSIEQLLLVAYFNNLVPKSEVIHISI